MAESHVISALVTKRAELFGKLQSLQAEIAQIEVELAHLDATIKLFDPAYDLRTIKPRKKRRPNALFEHGELNRMVLDVMRQAQSPISAQECAVAIAKAKDFSNESPDALNLERSVLQVLKRLAKSQQVRPDEALSETGDTLWRLD